MRIKITGSIIENIIPQKTNYNHEIYSMILANLTTDKAKEIHEKKRFKRLFTFSDIYIKNNEINLYVSGIDSIIKDFINNIMFNQIIRIGDKVVNITNIEQLSSNLDIKDYYIFKTNFIVNEKDSGKVCLSKNSAYIKNRISQIIIDKYNEINSGNIDKNIKVGILSSKHKYTKYKNHHLNSYKSILKISGDYDLINLLYNVGVGENTASGHGFVWEVNQCTNLK